jgi:hypothetical protein
MLKRIERKNSLYPAGMGLGLMNQECEFNGFSAYNLGSLLPPQHRA